MAIFAFVASELGLSRDLLGRILLEERTLPLETTRVAPPCPPLKPLLLYSTWLRYVEGRAASVAVWVNTATVLTEQQRCVDSVLTCGCWRRYGVLACAGVVMCGGVGTGGCGAVELPHVCRVEPPDALTVCTLLL